MLVGFEVLLLLVVPQQSFPLFVSHTFGCEVVVRLVRPRLVWSGLALFAPHFFHHECSTRTISDSLEEELWQPVGMVLGRDV